MLSRRDLLNILPAGAAACLGCTSAASCAAQTANQTTPPPPPAGFGEKVDLTWEQAFDRFYRGYAQVMKKLAAQIGHEEFIAKLQKASSEAARERAAALLPPQLARDLSTFASMFAMQSKTDPTYRHALVYDIVEQGAAFEIHVSQCLWAKTFRAQDAADIGYAAICYPDYAATTIFNPKLKMIRTKTLMQGDDCCNHRWVMEG